MKGGDEMKKVTSNVWKFVWAFLLFAFAGMVGVIAIISLLINALL
jgi:hypothetical protein